MPRTVNLEQRQLLVSEAAWRVLARDGLTELSVRRVAAEAGLPPSSLRYTFPTQASVREVAVALIIDRLSSRVALLESEQSPTARARALVLELLPLDPDRRTEMEVSLALGAMAMTDPDLERSHRRVMRAVRDLCGTVLDLIGAPATELDATHALIDGLALHLVRQPPQDDTDWAVRVVDDYLARLSTVG